MPDAACANCSRDSNPCAAFRGEIANAKSVRQALPFYSKGSPLPRAKTEMEIEEVAGIYYDHCISVIFSRFV